VALLLAGSHTSTTLNTLYYFEIVPDGSSLSIDVDLSAQIRREPNIVNLTPVGVMLASNDASVVSSVSISGNIATISFNSSFLTHYPVGQNYQTQIIPLFNPN